MIFKKKRIVAQRRTEDTVPFVIPKIEDENKKKGYEHDHFVSPIFGRSTKDDVVIPNPHKHQGDLDKQLDPFRTKPKLTKEKMKEKYGTEFPEFDLVSGRNLNEAMKSHGRKKVRPNDPVREEPVKIYKEEPVYEEPGLKEETHIEKPKTNINE
ncbi:hypothetical protein OAO42_00160, partial [Candidatus Izimaplasma bacterium]|nr:hypothetical protein [Candidatus Izimaplasma bacterium]